MQAAIYGCAGPALTAEERAFFRDADPWGFILFARNIENTEQTCALSAALRETVGREAPILIDQEGGRVARLKPPLVPARPPQGVLPALMAQDEARALEAAFLLGKRLAADCRRHGVTVNCVPMLDVRQPDADAIIGDRALGEEPGMVARLGRRLAEGTLEGGCLPVAKHIPGHGRATADSHLALPRVAASIEALEAVDFPPFLDLADLPLGMTAHIVYEAVDAQLPATLSEAVIAEVVRGRLGFDGLLMTDDLSMQALTGSVETRAAASLAAGCDLVLHCNGDMAEMTAVAAGVRALTPPAEARSTRALSLLRGSDDSRAAEEEERLAALLGGV